MKKLLIIAGIVLGGLVAVLVVVVGALYANGSARLSRTYDIQPDAVALPNDAEALAEGKRLASIYCASCHGENFAGTDFFNDPALAVVDAPNLTAGRGGIAASYTDSDWVRSVRLGVDPQGRPLFIMPSKDFYYFSDQDLGSIIAYLKSVAPVDNLSEDYEITVMGRALIAAGAFGDIIAAESIDHRAARPSVPARGDTAEYGAYLANTFGCITCHGAELAGGKSPEPGAPLGPNLTPGGSLAQWAPQDFINVIRARRSDFMPFESLNKMSDEELTAIFLYLQSLPALETAVK